MRMYKIKYFKKRERGERGERSKKISKKGVTAV